MSYQEGVAFMAELVTAFKSGLLGSNEESEADTRAKLIDQILTRILAWPEAQITRENHHEVGRSDYILRCPNPILVVEAKRQGEQFSLPVEKTRRAYALSALRSEAHGVGPAVMQARGYADENGIEFACATNGVQWIVFRAITPGEPWFKGRAIIFRSLDDIEANFTDFWNILSYEAIQNQSLKGAFSSAIQDRLVFQRALDGVLYADGPLQRNKLSAQLQPLIAALFRDLTGTEQDEVLRQCYVVDRMVNGVSKEVSEIFNDTLPVFARQANFLDLVETAERSGALDSDFRQAISRGDYGTTILLLGGVGSGKTTFIHRFFRITAKEFVDNHCIWFYIPFTDAPLDAGAFGSFLRQRILRDFRSRYKAIDISSPAALRRIYQEPLQERESGLWRLLNKREKIKREVEFLESQINGSSFCDDVLKYLRRMGFAVTVVVDNVDQRAPDEQLRIFLLAHELCVLFDAVIIVALREESFFRAEQSGAFNAYHNVRYHIASPDVRSLLRKRVEFALRESEKGEERLRLTLRSGAQLNTKEIHDFMRILNEGALKENPAIGQFIDAVGLGNMRAALDMFNQFMVSGSTNVEKMLDIYKKQRRYNVAEHEFVKAVMQGDFLFYKEKRSPVLNCFEVSGLAGASNLTTLRILEFLSQRSGTSSSEGVGFVRIEDFLGAFIDVFGDSDDAVFHSNRLIAKRLIESDNRQIDQLAGARFVRITRSGLYYLGTLTRRFQYLDLVSLDTPIWDKRIVQELRSRATATPADIESRFYRIEWFLIYLKREEERSLSSTPKGLVKKAFGESLIARLESGLRNDLVRVSKGAKITIGYSDTVRDEVARQANEGGRGGGELEFILGLASDRSIACTFQSLAVAVLSPYHYLVTWPFRRGGLPLCASLLPSEK